MTCFLSFLVLILFILAVGLFALYAIQIDRNHRLVQDKRQLQESQQQVERNFQAVADRFRPVMNLDDEAQKVRHEIQRLNVDRDALQRSVAQERQKANIEQQRFQEVQARLQREVSLIDDRLTDISFGLYQPHYRFDSSDRFRAALEKVRQAKKEMIRAERATRFHLKWAVANSEKEGEKMQSQLAKLMLRAFNGECDAATANVTWNNITRMEARIANSYEGINKLGAVIHVSIVPEYKELALQELRLEFEEEEKKEAEREEQRRIKEQMREEERAQRELRRAEQEAAEDEQRYSKALNKAREEVTHATGIELQELNRRIAELQAEVKEAHERHERAISMAQLTRCGYVYIISNIGSFGEGVFKIGMTRRNDPMERVWELGDASVPFDFDVHGMIYSDDAPALEKALHDYFRSRAVNLVNPRKEFFRVTLDEIGAYLQSNQLSAYLKSKGDKLELTKLAEAKEYRQTLTIRESKTAIVPTAPVEPAHFSTVLE